MAKDSDGQEGLLVDIDTGIMRRDRLLMQSGQGGTVFVGFGRRAAQLDRFAFSDDHDPDPFIARCRQIAEIVESGELAKAERLGVPPAIIAIEDRALRRLAIAEALAKAGFNPGELRVPAGNPGGGDWTSGDASAGTGVVPAAASAKDVPTEKDDFVGTHLADAQKVADELHVPVENILGLSALESGWGTSRFAAEGNNYFGIHYPAPFATGFTEAVSYVKDKNGTYVLDRYGNRIKVITKVATFDSYADSLRSFVKISGSIVMGKSDPAEFARALQDSGKFGINPDTGAKKPTYVHDVSKTIEGLRPFIARRRV